MKYELCEKVFVYYTIEADTEEQAWQKFEKIKVPYGDYEIACADVFECDIVEVTE
jgi:hypothetical protein